MSDIDNYKGELNELITAKVIADSINWTDSRVTTLELEYPRYIHSELMTHRVFSRNAASSRAIPVDKMIDIIVNQKEFFPIWTETQKGMQGKIITDEDRILTLNTEWKMARAHATHAAWNLKRAGVHKQNINRLLEPYQFMKTLVTATDWDNFFYLRIAPDVMPEMQLLAIKMKQAIASSEPRKIEKDEWHLPYIKGDEGYDEETAKKISVSCCAQVSYRKLDTSMEKALDIFQKLVSGDRLHASAFEHVCTPILGYDAPLLGNLKGWTQYRHIVEARLKAGLKI